VVLNDGTKKFKGTGFFITPDGYVLTAYHCIGDSPPQIVIETRFDGESVAELKKDKSLKDRKYDIAVLKVDYSPSHYLPLGIVSNHVSGNQVVAFGYPAWNAKTNDEIGEYYGNISKIRSDHKLEIPNAIKGQGQSGGPIYHYRTHRIIAITSRGYDTKITDNGRIEMMMTDTGLSVRFDPLFEKWSTLEPINIQVAQSWDKRLKQLIKYDNDTTNNDSIMSSDYQPKKKLTPLAAKKKELLENRLSELIQQLEAVFKQMSAILDMADKLVLKKKANILEKEIEETQEELNQL